MKTLKRNSYGFADFSVFSQLNYAYVDKTKFIAILEELDTKANVFLRPRRFGKSLFVDTLLKYYDISYKNQFESLFKNTWIHENKTAKQGTYVVLSFVFSGIDTTTQETLTVNFSNALLKGFYDIADRYPSFDISDVLNSIPNYKNDPVNLFTELFMHLKNTLLKDLNAKCFLIIDEYDQFANEILANDIELFRKITSKNGFVKTFYSQLKNNFGISAGISDIYITGVTSNSLDSLISSFNIATNISNLPVLNELAGFTFDEIEKLVDELLNFNLLDKNITKEKILSIMKDNYDGYSFNKNVKEHLYNSTLCLNLLKRLKTEYEIPKDLSDPAVSADVYKLQGILSLASDDLQLQIAQEIVDDNLASCELLNNINLNKLCHFDRNEVLTILNQLGYLTLDTQKCKTTDNTFLKVPNFIFAKLFLSYYANIHHIREDFPAPNLKELALNGDITPLLTYTQEELLQAHPTNDFASFNECSLKIYMFLNLMKNSNGLELKREFYTGVSSIDLLFLNKNSGSNCHNIALEVKYINPKNYSESFVQKELNTAIEELKKSSTGTYMKKLEKKTDYYALIFYKKSCIKCQKVDIYN